MALTAVENHSSMISQGVFKYIFHRNFELSIFFIYLWLYGAAVFRDDAAWAQAGIKTIMRDVNYKRKELLSLLNKNPHQPLPMLMMLWQSFFLNSRFYETQGASVTHLSCDCCDWLPSFPFGFLLYLLFIYPSFIFGIVLSFLPAIVDIPHCCCKHNVSEAEKQWLASNLSSANPELCSKNIEKFILLELEKIATELTRRYPSTPFCACKDSFSWSEGENNSSIHTRYTYVIRRGTSPSPSSALTV